MFARSLIAALFVALPAVTALDTVTCFSTTTASVIKVAGSTTVQPLAIAWASGFKAKCTKASVTVEGGGSGAGAKLVCNSTAGIDIGALSREWKSSESTLSSSTFQYKCATSSLTGRQLSVANDALVVVAHPALTSCLSGGLTVGQLRWIFSNYTDAKLISTGFSSSELKGTGSTKVWSRLFSSCPSIGIKLVGPDSAAGTYSYFLETILTDNKAGEGFTKSAYTPFVVEANILPKVKSTAGAIGYCGFAVYERISGASGAIKIKNPTTGAYYLPGSASIPTGLYKPLSRKLYMMVKTASILKVRSYIQYGFSTAGTSALVKSGYYSLTATEQATMRKRLGLTA